MKKAVTLSIICMLSFQLIANDAVLTSRGATLVPTKETNVQLRKEKLILKKVARFMEVDVYFEFFNPDQEQKLTVGFIAPPASGVDYTNESDIENRSPTIYGFLVKINGEHIQHKRTLLRDTEFDFLKSKRRGETFIYYFEVTFKPGINIIKHAYEYRGGGDSMGNDFYDYILTSGTYWANKQIDNFTMTLDMGDDAYFSIGRDFMENPGLSLEINGKANRKGNEFFVKEGYLTFKATNFKPRNEFSVYFINQIWNHYTDEHQHMNFSDKKQLSQLDKETLRIMRNNFFAREGYKFKSQDLFNHYKQFIWYFPVDSLTSEDIYNNFTPAVQERIELMKRIEDSK